MLKSLGKIESIITRIQESGYKLSLTAAGCCSTALSWFTLFPGSSRCTIETRSPYAKKATEDFLGFTPEQFVSKQVSTQMGRVSFLGAQDFYLRGQDYEFDDEKSPFKGFIGVGVTGALQTTRTLKGGHRAYMTLFTEQYAATTFVEITNDKLSRFEQDHIFSHFLTLLIGKHCKLELEAEFQDFVLEHKEDLVILEYDVVQAHDDIIDLVLTNQLSTVILTPNDHTFHNLKVDGFVILAGSFNPLHDAHVELAKLTAKQFNIPERKILFELSIKNAEKGMIDKGTIFSRLEQFKRRNLNVMLSNKALFSQKNEYATNCYFSIGADTYKRIVNPKFYADSYDKMVLALGEFSRKDNKLVVFPRLNPDTGSVENLEDFIKPDAIKSQVDEIRGYRNDLSSTLLRKKQIPA